MGMGFGCGVGSEEGALHEKEVSLWKVVPNADKLNQVSSSP